MHTIPYGNSLVSIDQNPLCDVIEDDTDDEAENNVVMHRETIEVKVATAKERENPTNKFAYRYLFWAAARGYHHIVYYII